PSLSVVENLAFWIALSGRKGEAGEMARALAIFGLEPLGSIPARFLSAGQRRRLSLARLAVIPASLWLLDEPTVGLDGGGMVAVEQAIAGHRRTGGMAVVATHIGIDLPGAQSLDLARFGASGTGS